MKRSSWAASRRHWSALLAIALILGLLVLTFSWLRGWVSGGRLTAESLNAQLGSQAAPGFRLAHAKGHCFRGRLLATGHAAYLSTARVLRQPITPVIGRFSIGHGDPWAADSVTKTTSMALLLATDDGQQWRMALNSTPFFPTSTPQGLAAMLQALAPDPGSGEPEPRRVAAFLAAHPSASRFLRWEEQAPWADSYASATTYSVHAFLLVDSQSQTQAVRWQLRPRAAAAGLSAAQRALAEPDFLSRRLQSSLEQGPVYFDWVLQLAQAGDPIDDPSQPWPSDRQELVAGTLEVQALEPQAACSAINFDPTLLPSGVRLSADPVLLARASSYALSFRQRMTDVGLGRAALGRAASAAEDD